MSVGRPPRVHAARALAAGLRTAASQRRVLVAIWSWHLVVAAAAALPMFTWLRSATAHRPAADVLVERWSFGTVSELLQYTEAPILEMLRSGAVAAVALATVAAPLFIALVLRSLGTDAASSTDLGRAAVRMYWPLLRALILGRAVALAGVALTALGVASAMGPLRASLGEAGLWSGLLLLLAATAIVGMLLLAACDYALVEVVERGGRSAVRAWLRGARAALTHPVAAVLLWAGAGVLLAVLLGLYGVISARLPVGTMSLVVAGVLVQQLFMLGRTWVRVGLLGAERSVFLAVSPAPPLPEAARAPAGDDMPLLPFGDDARSRAPGSAGRAAQDDAEPSSVEDEQHPGPGQDGEREIEDREQRQDAVERQQVQHDRAGHGEQLGHGEAGSDAEMVHVVRDERVAFTQAEGGDAEIGERPVEHLRAEEEHQHDVAEPATRRGGR